MLRAVKAVLAFVVAVVIVGAAIIGGTNAYVVVTTKDDIVSEAEAAAFQADCIVVLGAAVTPEEEPSGIWKTGSTRLLRSTRQARLHASS